MTDLEVKVEYFEDKTIYGLWTKSNDRTIGKDIDSISHKYHETVSVPSGKVLPYYVLSKSYNEKSGDFEMLVGGEIANGGLESYTLPAGEYAVITVKPKMGFLWGAAVGEAKRYFYTKWISENPYKPLNMEYEYHTEKTVGAHPTVDIVFAISRKV